MRRSTTALLGTVALVALAAGCGTDSADDPSNASATRRTSPALPSDSPGSDGPSSEPSSDGSSDDGPEFPTDTASQTAEPQGEWDLVLTGVRVGDHDGYDRIVMEFAGTGTPGWSLGYVDDPVQEGSGEPLDLAGDAYLDVYASGTTYPMEGDPSYEGPTQFVPEAGGLVVDVRVGGTFEGYTQLTAGLAGDARPFRAFALTDPPRLVVDVVDRP